MLSSPFIARPLSVDRIMRRVLYALLPGIVLYVWYFGPAILMSIALAVSAALATEALMLKLRERPLRPFLSDYSALLTGVLIALSIPPLAPWWLPVVGAAFAIAVAKHLYGGLGSNPFNPAMIGYAVLIISFPQEMTQWLSPQGVGQSVLSFGQQLHYIFSGILPAGMQLDALTMSTPLDTLKTQLHLGMTVSDIRDLPIYGRLAGKGSEMVAAGFALGGLYLLMARIIPWQLPVAFLGTLFALSGVFNLIDPTHYAPPLFHWFSGAAMIGAFFILTDPITSPTTARGRIVFGIGAGILTFLIRAYGGFPDGVAFATILMNMCVPLIDAWTQPRIFGKKKEDKR